MITRPRVRMLGDRESYYIVYMSIILRDYIVERDSYDIRHETYSFQVDGQVENQRATAI